MMIYPHGNGIVIMRKVCFHKYGGVEVLQLEEIKSRKLEGGEIRIKTKAIGVNPVDTYFRGGAYKVPRLPWTPGSDFAGVVEEIGSKKALMGALKLYLDFINLFIMLLHLFGQRR